MTNIETPFLTGSLTRAIAFSNTAWSKTVPAGSEVLVRASAVESGQTVVYAYLPGSGRYSALLPVSAIRPI
jgi:hypothetical protein